MKSEFTTTKQEPLGVKAEDMRSGVFYRSNHDGNKDNVYYRVDSTLYASLKDGCSEFGLPMVIGQLSYRSDRFIPYPEGTKLAFIQEKQ